ncbi:hypothetical protein [Hydrocarboniphaga effusa]|uniref:hypothetical protein n=1 Tax=Hydrocarboniphaga effusa TaxID=243629 RepID=UPI003BADA781
MSKEPNTEISTAAAGVLASASSTVQWVTEPSGGDALYKAIRAGLMLKGMTFHAWCTRHNVRHQWARQAVTGKANGPAARKLRKRIASAAGLAA